MNSFNKTLAIVVLSILAIVFCGWMTTRVVKGVIFDRECEGHLKRASDANTISLAAKELTTAVDYLNARGFTEGYTSVFYRTPDEDIGFWYNNLSQSLTELKECPDDATQLEKSNLLMKLRETLLDDGQSGVRVTVPMGMSIYPYNFLYFLWSLSGLLLCLALVIAMIVGLVRY
jgi:hypothetical protein